MLVSEPGHAELEEGGSGCSRCALERTNVIHVCIVKTTGYKRMIVFTPRVDGGREERSVRLRLKMADKRLRLRRPDPLCWSAAE